MVIIEATTMRSQFNQRTADYEAPALPGLFLERLRAIIPEPYLNEVLNTFSCGTPVSFRLNKPDLDEEAVLGRLESQGLAAERVPWLEGAFMLRQGTLRELQATGLDGEGAIYVQGLSSMAVPLVLDPKPGEKILDLAAAPGSKTTQMALMLRGQGEITANDNNRSRFFRLVHQVRLQGLGHIKPVLFPGEVFGRRFPDHYDRVLLDAPCSSEGRFRAGVPSTFRYWKPAKIREMARKQKNLLVSAIRAVRPGGVLVYSTCTFAPEENEAVLDWALDKFGNLIEIEQPVMPFDRWTEGLAGWGKQTFDPRVARARRILPGADFRAFFIARIRKKGGCADA